MFTFVLIIHILSCLLLIGIILIQQGRGGGLVDSFSGVESMFGTKTSTFLTRSTTVLATTFIITCLLLAFLSAQKNKSVLERVKLQTPKTQPQLPLNQTEAPKAEIPKAGVEQAPVSAPLQTQNQTAAP